MKKKLIFVFITFIIACIIILTLYNSYTEKTDEIITLKGENKYWSAYLNVSLSYNARFSIDPISYDFKIPKEITIELITDNKRVYSTKLDYIPRRDSLGYFKTDDIISEKYFNNKTNQVELIIKYDNQEQKITLYKCD